MSRPGGTSQVKPADAEAQAAADAVRAEAAEKLGVSGCTDWKALQYCTQVVAGTNFFVTVDVGEDNNDYPLLRIYKDLQGNYSLAAVSRVKEGGPPHYIDRA